MPDTYNYPAEIERDEDGRHVVTFPDFGWGATDGATRDEALDEAKDLLRELIATTIRESRDLPDPVARDQAPALGRSAGADCSEGSHLRGMARRWNVAAPPRPRARHRRERGAAHTGSGTRHQGRNDRRRVAAVGKARLSDHLRGSLIRSRRRGVLARRGAAQGPFPRLWTDAAGGGGRAARQSKTTPLRMRKQP